MFIHEQACIYCISFSFLYNVEKDINSIYTSILLQWSTWVF